MNATPPRRHLHALTLGALGVVYGDIGTSPLYALKECFKHEIAPDVDSVLGVLSLVVWSLVLIVCVKYVAIMLRADNRGEGGILALLALATRDPAQSGRRKAHLLMLGVIGAALLYGDGMITPCVTVFGAIEGLNVASTQEPGAAAPFAPYVVPLSLLVLLGMFAVQSRGTERVGRMFGPVMLVWFAALAVLGTAGIVASPTVLRALLPHHGVAFLFAHGYTGFLVLGSVFLVVTGAEALYADLGHFGPAPIRRAWFTVVFPALLLNYLGQGALLLRDPSAQDNPFFKLAPGWALYPLVVLSTAASVIASQALISGAFSLTMQAIQLGLLPRLEIRHTSSVERGQIYLPWINRILLLCCMGLALGFQSSDRLASAYGIAVTLTMLITTLLFFVAAKSVWQWPLWRTVPLCTLFLGVETVFFAANATKVAQGGWFPLLVAAALFTVMSTWKLGRRRLGERLAMSSHPLDTLMTSLAHGGALRVPGTAVYMAGNPNGTPIALLHNLKHNKVLHQNVVLLTFTATDEPHVDDAGRVRVEPLPLGFRRIVASFGFMETPKLDVVQRAAEAAGHPMLMRDTTFFLSRETILASGRSMARWRASLFAFLARNGQSATAFFGLPVDRVVELGLQVEI